MISVSIIKVRIVNYGPLSKIKLIKSGMYDKFISVIGIVSKVSNSMPKITRLAMECKKCNTTFVKRY
jgi:DNA replicative helicase MCM subunit Mcm2 (Cdc46/Mcm family)